MIKHFLTLEWKQFFRSANFGKSVGVKILMAFVALWLIVSFLAVGASGYSIIKKEFPDIDPLLYVNRLLIFAFISDLIFRYLMQKLPIMNIKPLLHLPIKKTTLVHYVLGKSAFSFFNILSLFYYIPFAIVLLKEGYNTAGVLGWLFLMLLLILCVNFINFLINKNNYAFIAIVALLLLFFVAYQFKLFNVTNFFGNVFQSVYTNPAVSLVAIVPLIGLYYANFKQLRDKIYLDDAIKNKVEEVKSSDLSFVDKLGDVAPFIKNDMRLIWRNKRTKTVFLMSFLFLFMGLMFFKGKAYENNQIMQLYGAIFITGGFAMNYGQFVPAWDSEHYRLLMTQNFSYRKYLESKWYLMTVMTVVLFVLATPYLYFGLNKYLLIVAGFFFNLGFTPLIMLYMGAYNKKRIKLNASGFGNSQGTSATQFIVPIIVMVTPMIIYAVVNNFFGFNQAVITIAAIGVITFLLKNPIMNAIEKKYQQKKYITIHGFKQQ